MNTLTVETTSRVLEKLNICFTEGGVESRVVSKKLMTSPKSFRDSRYSSYNYTIQMDSLVEYLQCLGFTNEVIKKVLPYEI